MEERKIEFEKLKNESSAAEEQEVPKPTLVE